MPMVSQINFDVLRGYHEVDDQCVAILRENKDFLIEIFDEHLSKCYEHLWRLADAVSAFDREETLGIAKQSQIRHWSLLFDARFDADYHASAKLIFDMRVRFGLGPQWYTGGYCFIAARMHEAIAARFPNKILRFFASRRRENLQLAVMRALMLDMAYSINISLASNREERAGAFNRLAHSFEDAVGGIAGRVLSTAEHLRGTASTLTHSAETTNLQSMAAATASKQAATSVEAIASATSHLSQAIGEISAQVHQSNRIAGHAAVEADQTHAEVRGLAEATDRIGGIVELIRNIAGQTNMLALNATIEAARAGDAGRGFAIVAQEVKSLADATARATAEIGAQVAGIQDATQHVTAFIASIASTTRQVSSIAVAVEDAVAEQAQVTQEIARRIREASNGTNEVTSNIVGATRSAASSSQAAKELLQSATDLTSQAGVLSKHVEDLMCTIRGACS
jgi:methyl-accepting chemotaxis protein